jgi:CBS domain-containing protein
MFDQSVRSVMQPQKLVKVPPDMAVDQAARLMARKNLGAILVVEEDRLVGILTERDIAYRVVAPGLDPQATRLAAVMTPSPETIDPGKPFGYALLRMQERGFRHLPVVEDGKLIGIVSSRSAMDPAMEEFATEAHRRKHYQLRR